MNRNYIAKDVLAKGRRLSVYYRLELKNPHMKGPCACGKAEGAMTVHIVVDKVKDGQRPLSPNDLVARNASSKVQNAMKSGKRMCEEHLKELLEVAKQEDRLHQVFVS